MPTKASTDSLADQYRIKPGSTVDLTAIDPDGLEDHEDSKASQAQMEKNTERLRDLQYLLYAEGQRGVLICLQAMDTGGKDGLIRHVFGVMNPQGCRVHAFKAPTAVEAAHDFLWRMHKVTPAQGETVIFNRSHYEDVLVPRVHNSVPKAVWSARYDAINQFEKHLADNRIHIIKIFLHISKEEQLRRFSKRLENPAKRWKISEADYSERKYWDAYQDAYQDLLQRCSTSWAPWYVIPANHKHARDQVVLQLAVDFLESLNMAVPLPTVDLESIRAKYHAEVRKQGKMV